MIITNHGKQFFKIQQGDTVIAINPISKDSKEFNKVKFGSNIVLVTTNHPDFNGIENATYGDNEPFVVEGPGEYEISDIFITGFETKSVIDGKEYYNTVYKIRFEEMVIVFCGNISSDLDPKIKEQIVEPDLLFVPINGNNTIDPVKAHKLANSLEAKAVVPMDFDKANLAQFLKESGENVEPTEKATLKKKDFTEMKGNVIVLK
jgi:L-ascorbate metabolism protein UlaG (beta-lactamase superfamily)